MADPTARTPALELKSISRTFGDLVANDDVSLRVQPGEILALLGENGAGKSTLMNICFGIIQPSSGEIVVDGQAVTMSSPTVARRHGIGMVHQHFKLVPSLTVAENVFLGAEPRLATGALDRAAMQQRVREVSERYGLSVDPRATIADLSAGMRQRVEVLKALTFDAKVLILDEPTAVLTPQETDALFDVLRSLAADGRAVIVITHKLREVKAVSHRFSVLRRGRLVASGDTADHSEHDLATLMVGREVSLGRPTPVPEERVDSSTALRCESLVLLGAQGNTLLDHVSFDARAGEIVGIAGVEGNGQSELIEAIAGLRRLQSGSVTLGAQEIGSATPAARRAAGLAHVPEDRIASGVSTVSTVRDNLVAGFLRSTLFRWRLLRTGAARIWSRRLIDRYDVRGASPATAAGQLSGGNMQKVVIARELESRPAVLLAAQPTRGVDVGAIEFIHDQMRAQAAAGSAIVFSSADLGEVLALSDRVLVMYGGRIVAEFAPREDRIERIGLAMAGAADPRDEYRFEERPVEAGAPTPTQHHEERFVVPPADLEAGEAGATRERRPVSVVVDRVVSALSQPVIAVVSALLVGLVIIAILGKDPLSSYQSFLFGSFRNLSAFNGLVVQATPLLILAASVFLSFRAGIFNIGAEGQMYVGAFAGALIALQLPDLPGPALILLCFVAGMVAGAIWGLLPGLLQAYLGIDILVSTLMFNYVGMSLTAFLVSGSLRDPSAGTVGTRTLPEQVALPQILGFGGANIGVFLGIAAIVILGILVARSSWGFGLRFSGENPRFARTVGVNVQAQIVQIMCVSGAVAGIAGVVETLGIQMRFNQAFSPGFGFVAITIALLGRLRPVGIIVAAFLYGALRQGASLMQLQTGAPLSLINVIEGIIIILTTAAVLTIHLRRRGRTVVPAPGAAPLVAGGDR